MSSKLISVGQLGHSLEREKKFKYFFLLFNMFVSRRDIECISSSGKVYIFSVGINGCTL